MFSSKMRMYLLCLIALLANGAGAQVLFQDDFSDGDASGWNERYGNWSVIGQEYIGDFDLDKPGLFTTTGDPSWSNYMFEARMKLVLASAGWNDFGLIFHDQGDGEALRFSLNGGDGEEPRISYVLYEEGGESFPPSGEGELATFVSKATIMDGEWYDVKLCIMGDYVYAYVDSQLVAYADNLPFTQGYIGLNADDPIVHFDDIVITTITPAKIDIVKDTIATNTKTVTCNIWPPSCYDVTQIDLGSIRLEGTIPPDRISVRNHQQMLVATFPTSGLSLAPTTELLLTVTGDITDGPSFEDHDSVAVVRRGGNPH